MQLSELITDMFCMSSSSCVLIVNVSSDGMNKVQIQIPWYKYGETLGICMLKVIIQKDARIISNTLEFDWDTFIDKTSNNW